MTDELQQVLTQAKRWIEQERVWGDSFYASPVPSIKTPVAVLSEVQLNADSQARDSFSITVNHTSSDKTAALLALYEQFKDCTRCPLGLTRIKFVFAAGNPNAQVMFIGEGPGYEEDRRGEPFVGKAGQLLDKIMGSIGLSRQTNAYIANIVKCHPMANPATPEARGNDRPPAPEEVETCSPILLGQIAIIQPKIIVTLGSPSTRMILKTKDGITQLRGKYFPFGVDSFYPPSPEGPMGAGRFALDSETREILRGIRVLPTFHPAALLRNPNLKPETWTDMKLLRDTLGLPSSGALPAVQ